MYFESSECDVSFGEEATKEEFLGNVSNTGVLEARLSQSLSDSCSARGEAGRDVLSQLAGHQRLYLRCSVTSYMDLKEMKEEIAQAKEKLLKTVEGSKKLLMS